MENKNSNNFISYVELEEHKMQVIVIIFIYVYISTFGIDMFLLCLYVCELIRIS